jgi:hypothetical protein
MTFVQLTNAKMEFVITLKRRIVMITTHVLWILVTKFLDVNTAQFHVAITTFVLLINAILKLDVSTLLRSATITTLALKIVVIESKDASLLQDIFVMEINAQEKLATFVLEKFLTLKNHVTITTLAQLILAILK